MFIFFNLMFMFMFVSLILFLFMLKFIIMKMNLFIEIFLFKFNSMNFSVLFYFDFKSLMFMSVVLMISSMIILYSVDYMMFDKNNVRFIYLLMLFVFSMLLMISGQNLLMILLGWDGLGLISYCLVIYYNNWSSYNSGMITILTNRLGDIGLLLSIGMLSMFGDWNFLLLNSFNFLIFIFIVLACFTKSAQIPFSSWLPMAMAAPTPISALVHSSTLVTAGVYLLMRFSKILLINKIFFILILFLSLMTMFFSSMIAVFENDFKKIIALSTLSQLGLMMMSMIMNLKMLGFFHLIIHAMFKSLMFMCAGLFLHSMMNNQDIRNLGGAIKSNFLLTLMMFICSNLALCGFPFMSGFYSKDMILESMLMINLNYFILIIFYLSIMLTIIYSFRLIYYMIINFMKFYCFINLNDLILMNISMLLMFLFSICGGSIFNWLIFSSISLLFISYYFKILLLMLMMISMILGLMSCLMNFFFILKYKKLFNFMKNMFFMNYFSMILSKNFLVVSLFYYENIDQGWIEYYCSNLLKFISIYKFLNILKINLWNIFFMLIFFSVIYIYF